MRRLRDRCHFIYFLGPPDVSELKVGFNVKKKLGFFSLAVVQLARRLG